MYDATPSYCCIATVSHIGFPSLYSKYKWPNWPSWVKKAEASINSIHEEHLDDEVETKEPEMSTIN